MNWHLYGAWWFWMLNLLLVMQSTPLFIGISQRKLNVRPTAFFFLKCSLTAEEIQQCYSTAQDGFESTQLYTVTLVSPHSHIIWASNMLGDFFRHDMHIWLIKCCSEHFLELQLWHYPKFIAVNSCLAWNIIPCMGPCKREVLVRLGCLIVISCKLP